MDCRFAPKLSSGCDIAQPNVYSYAVQYIVLHRRGWVFSCAAWKRQYCEHCEKRSIDLSGHSTFAILVSYVTRTALRSHGD